MGQQQLLLLVLGTVIVGIAIVIGINAFRENSVRSNYDAMVQDGIRIANDLQQWKLRPEMFGGSPDASKTDPTTFTGADLLKLGYLASPYINMNGSFTLAPPVITGTNDVYENSVTIQVRGVRDCDIVITQGTRGGQAVTYNPTGCTE